MHTTLFCKVGRAEAKPVQSLENSPLLDAQLAAVQARHFTDLIAGGVDPARITFQRVAGNKAADNTESEKTQSDNKLPQTPKAPRKSVRKAKVEK